MKKIRIWQVIILITVCGLIAINSQAQTPKINSAENFAPTPVALNGEKRTNAPIDCESDLETANARLLKTLDALEKAEVLIKTLQTEIEARKNLDAINAAIIEKQTARFNDAEKEIALLKKKAQRKFSILFGLISLRY